MLLLTAPTFKKSHILAWVYFIFPKNVPDESFNTRFGPQWKDRISSYQIRQILGSLCNFVALALG